MKPPFAWVRLDGLERIRQLPPPRQKGARDAYLALAETASRNHDGAHDTAYTLKAISTNAAGSDRRLRGYLQDLASIGLIEVADERDDVGRDLATTYLLLDSAREDRTSDHGEARSDSPDTKPSPRSDTSVSETASEVSDPTRARPTSLEEEEQEEDQHLSSDAVPAPDPEPAPVDPEVVRLCHLLANLITDRDPKAQVKPDGDRWQRSMRLLLADRADDSAEVERVLRWSQDEPFWQPNILSPTKLREKFTQLLMQSSRPAGRGVAGGRRVDPAYEAERHRRSLALRASQGDELAQIEYDQLIANEAAAA